ncbi:hypothetical protein L3X38_024148 [Prunus dulcis]|uniref:Ubiquitin thioesterase OTU n=1 Tax=Prunus dulcis TaxID=3755 RepID=A0AAD4Z5V5_PRUDU|nr:hypothetical protein L3X38_024148 [Prunus dulcis]
MKSIVLGFLTLRSGEEKYSERALLIYDGLHYDALAMSPFEGAPEEFDQTIFAVKDSTIGPVEGLALNLVKEEQSRPEGGCGACTSAGHVNFQEYR